MDEIFGRRDMIAPVKLKALSVKSDWRGFGQVGAHLGAVVLSGAALWLDLGRLVGGPGVHRAWDPDQLPLCRPA